VFLISRSIIGSEILSRFSCFPALLIHCFETQSLPSLLRRYRRSFTFYLGNPFPRFQILPLIFSLLPMRCIG